MSTLDGLCRAVLPPEAGGPDATMLAEAVERFATKLPGMTRAALRAGTAGVEAFALASTGHRLAELDVAARVRVLRRLATNPASAQAITALKGLVLLVAGAEGAAAEIGGRSQHTSLARPDAPINVTRARDWPDHASADVVIVGSGAGGAVVARSTARAGMRTLVIEEGRRFSVEEFRARHPLDRFAALYRDAGTTVAFGRPPIMLPIGRGVGGTTLVNSGTCYRTPEAVLRRWRDEAGLGWADPAEFGGRLDDVMAMLEVGPVPSSVMGRNGELCLAGAEALGWHAAPLQRNAPGCGGCCQCAIGCPRNAKFGVHLNALPDASAAGAQVVSELRAVRILHERGRATGLACEREDGSRVTISASRVVVACGATETPPLLRRSGLGRHPALGRRLSIHPAVSTAGRFDEPVVAWRGVLQSAAVEEFHERNGILVEATSTPPGMGSMVLPGIGPSLLEQLAGTERLATLGAMVADAPSGRVLGARHPLLVYQLAKADGARLLRSISIMGHVLFAAGAREVLTGLPGEEVVHSPAALDDALARARTSELHVAAFHPTGTAGAGADTSRFPVDPSGRLRGMAGVWVADASILPTSPTVNPQVSIMAAVMVIADAILAS